MSDDFVFCKERWHDPSRGDLSRCECSEHQPGHEKHECCCGSIKPEATP